MFLESVIDSSLGFVKKLSSALLDDRKLRSLPVEKHNIGCFRFHIIAITITWNYT